ncbi:hypothetical protein EJ110_NYTH06465 [Nymphaea thermarum]|nr:hypothetical protein EJ110_NYTH06465 [Nymphaea thermarum]
MPKGHGPGAPPPSALCRTVKLKIMFQRSAVMEMVGSMMSVRTLVVRVLPGLLLAWAVWKVLYEVWWKPWRIQRWLRKQGIHGPSYQLFFGNARETMSMFFEAWSKPMSLCHDIAPRVLPFFDHVVKKYAKGEAERLWFSL